MRICASVPELRVALAGAARPLGFFPTMGALHEGHAAVMRRCRAECATAVASVFLNPLQFGRGEDLDRYPRDLEGDRAVLEREGADVLFLPRAEDFYPEGFSTAVDIGSIGTLYEGAVRPGHFAGVCTVVLKLFAAVGPDRAYFGRKDAQQLAIVSKMVRDLNLPVEIVPADTVRDEEGLALSSRNAYLAPGDRRKALGLSAGLFRGRAAWENGERDPDRLVALSRDASIEYDYLACVDPRTFRPPPPGGPALLVAAVRVGGTRLIDNVVLEAKL